MIEAHILGARKKALSGKCVPGKQEGQLGSVTDVVAHTCDCSVGEVETGGPQKLAGQLVLPNW